MPPSSSSEKRRRRSINDNNNNTIDKNNLQNDRIRITVSTSSSLASKFPSLSNNKKKKNDEENDNDNDTKVNKKSYNLRKRKRPQDNHDSNNNSGGLVLSIAAKTDYKVLIQKIASKLISPEIVQDKAADSCRLLLGGDHPIEDTNEIEDGDYLVLDFDGHQKEVVENDEEEEEEEGKRDENDKSGKASCSKELPKKGLFNDSSTKDNSSTRESNDRSCQNDNAKENGSNKTENNVIDVESDDDDYIEDVTDQYVAPPKYDDVEDVTEEYMAQREKERLIKLEEAEPLYDDDEDDEEMNDDDKDVICIDDESSSSTEEETETEENDDDKSSDEEKKSSSTESHAPRASRAKKKGVKAAKRTPKKTTPKKKVSPKKKKEDELPPIEVIINEVDIPAAPGGCSNSNDDNEEKSEKENDNFDSSRSILHPKDGDANDNNTNKSASASIKKRIIKLLNAGFHPNSNEHEAKNAMKLARRLMERYNLSQALLLREDKDEKEASNELRGGMVTVQIVDRKKQAPLSCMSRWIESLIAPVCDNFNVEAYKTVCRKSCYRRNGECSVTFYGILNNAQCASYAYKIAVERISAMTALYHPDLDRDGNDEVSKRNRKRRRTSGAAAETRSARLSYALGIVSGIQQSVQEEKEREEKRKQEKLERARRAASKGEAYEESDEEEEGLSGFSGDGDDDGFLGNTDNDMKCNQENGEREELSSDLDPPAAATTSTSAETSDKSDDTMASAADVQISSEPCSYNDPNETAARTFPAMASSLTVSDRLERLEQEQSAALALIDHSKKIAEDVLKAHEIKVRKAAKRKSLNLNRLAYKKGVEDSKEIDLNQRAIRDDEEAKVKNEMSKKGRSETS